MKDDPKTKKPKKSEGKTRMTISLSDSDAKWLKKAIADGYFEKLGVEAIQMDSDEFEKKWTDDSRRRQTKPEEPSR